MTRRRRSSPDGSLAGCASQTPNEDTQPSPLPPTADHVDEALGYAYSSGAAGDGNLVAAADPCALLVAQLQNAKTNVDVRHVLHPAIVAEGFANASEAYNTTLQWLADIVGDDRDHRRVATEHTSLKRVCPAPMAAAIATVSLREGWWPECLQQEFLVCSAFLENEHTRLKLDGGESHRRSFAVPSFRGASMSARKSSLSEYGLSLIQDSPDATLDMKSGKWLAMDGTVRGLRDAFKAFQRGGVRSCEVSATYDIGFASQPNWCSLFEQDKGVHVGA